MVLPYLKGLIIIKCGFFYLTLWIYCVFSICGDYICRSVRVSIIKLWFFYIVLLYLLWCFCIQYLVLNNWYQSTFLGRSCGQIFFIFADFFFGEEKRGPRHSRHFQYIYVQNFQKRVVYLSSSYKNTQIDTKNRPKWSPGSQDIEVLKSANFQGFFHRQWRNFLLLLVL